MTTFGLQRSLSALLAICGALTVSACAQRTADAAHESDRVSRKEIFVLPRGYRGPFIAIYGQAEGVAPRWRGDTAVFRVPPDGILKMNLAEPPHSTKTSHVFDDKPDAWIDNYPTCADMRVYVKDSRPRICWLDYSVGGTRIPEHIVAVVTDWAGIPANFNRTAVVYDSVLLNGTGQALRKWTEPPDHVRRRPIG